MDPAEVFVSVVLGAIVVVMAVVNGAPVVGAPVVGAVVVGAVLVGGMVAWLRIDRSPANYGNHIDGGGFDGGGCG